MEVTELRPGLWRWAAPHLEWRPEIEADPDQGWARDVGCVFIEADDAICAVVAGDALVDLGRGPERTPWFRTGEERERSRRALLPLRELPVELVLQSHGPPVVEDAAERLAAALS